MNAENMFTRWTDTTRLCYKRKMVCDGCPNSLECEIGERHYKVKRNPYGIRRIKYAVLKTIEKVGIEDVEL